MSLHYCETLNGPVGVRIEGWGVAVRTPNEVGYERLLYMNATQALTVAVAMEQSALEILRRIPPVPPVARRACCVCGCATEPFFDLGDGRVICRQAGDCLERASM